MGAWTRHRPAIRRPCRETERRWLVRRTTQHHPAPHSTTLHHTAPPCTTQHHPAPHSTTLHHAAPPCSPPQPPGGPGACVSCNISDHQSPAMQGAGGTAISYPFTWDLLYRRTQELAIQTTQRTMHGLLALCRVPRHGYHPITQSHFWTTLSGHPLVTSQCFHLSSARRF